LDEGRRTERFSFSPDGKLLAGAGDGKIVLWEASEGGRWRAGRDRIDGWVVAFSRDGALLAVGGKNRAVSLMDLKTRKSKGELRDAKVGVWVAGMAFAPEGKTLATSVAAPDHPHGTGEVCIWDVATQKLLRKMGEADEPKRLASSGGQTLAFAPDGKRLAAVSSKPGVAVHLWDPATGKVLDTIKDDAKRIQGVSLSADGKVLAWGDGAGKVHVWDVAASKELAVVDAPASDATAVALAPNGQTLAMGGSRGIIRLWHTDNGKERTVPPEKTPGVRAAFFLPDGKRVLLAGDDGLFRVWDGPGKKERDGFGEKGTETLSAALAADGKLLATLGANGKPGLWDVASGKVRLDLEDVRQVARCLALSSDGQWLVAGDVLGNLHVWETATGKVRTSKLEQPSAINRVAFSPDNHTLAVGSEDGQVRVGDVRKETAFRVLDTRGFPIKALAFSPDGRLVAWCGERGGARVCEAETGKELRQFPPPSSGFTALCFSPDGRALAASETDHSVWVLESETGKPRRHFEGQRATVTDLAFSPDGRSLLAVGEDSQAFLWDVTGRQGAARPVADVDFTDLIDLCNDLKSADAVRAYRAMGMLAAVPKESVPFLNQRLHLATPINAKRLAKLLADLEDKEFNVQEKAATELEELGPAVVPHLRKALAGKPSLPVRRWLELALENVQAQAIDKQRLVILRALEVLERAGTPQAREVFVKLAEGEPGSWLTQEAKASLDRLARRGATP
jgi:WD40 repeat protein